MVCVVVYDNGVCGCCFVLGGLNVVVYCGGVCGLFGFVLVFDVGFGVFSCVFSFLNFILVVLLFCVVVVV